jgi:hypothetical protein
MSECAESIVEKWLAAWTTDGLTKLSSAPVADLVLRLAAFFSLSRTVPLFDVTTTLRTMDLASRIAEGVSTYTQFPSLATASSLVFLGPSWVTTPVNDVYHINPSIREWCVCAVLRSLLCSANNNWVVGYMENGAAANQPPSSDYLTLLCAAEQLAEACWWTKDARKKFYTTKAPDATSAIVAMKDMARCATNVADPHAFITRDTRFLARPDISASGATVVTSSGFNAWCGLATLYKRFELMALHDVRNIQELRVLAARPIARRAALLHTAAAVHRIEEEHLSRLYVNSTNLFIKLAHHCVEYNYHRLEAARKTSAAVLPRLVRPEDLFVPLEEKLQINYHHTQGVQPTRRRKAMARLFASCVCCWLSPYLSKNDQLASAIEAVVRHAVMIDIGPCFSSMLHLMETCHAFERYADEAQRNRKLTRPFKHVLHQPVVGKSATAARPRTKQELKVCQDMLDAYCFGDARFFRQPGRGHTFISIMLSHAFICAMLGINSFGVPTCCPYDTTLGSGFTVSPSVDFLFWLQAVHNLAYQLTLAVINYTPGSLSYSWKQHDAAVKLETHLHAMVRGVRYPLEVAITGQTAIQESAHSQAAIECYHFRNTLFVFYHSHASLKCYGLATNQEILSMMTQYTISHCPPFVHGTGDFLRNSQTAMRPDVLAVVYTSNCLPLIDNQPFLVSGTGVVSDRLNNIIKERHAYIDRSAIAALSFQNQRAIEMGMALRHSARDSKTDAFLYLEVPCSGTDIQIYIAHRDKAKKSVASHVYSNSISWVYDEFEAQYQIRPISSSSLPVSSSTTAMSLSALPPSRRLIIKRRRAGDEEAHPSKRHESACAAGGLDDDEDVKILDHIDWDGCLLGVNDANESKKDTDVGALDSFFPFGDGLLLSSSASLSSSCFSSVRPFSPDCDSLDTMSYPTSSSSSTPPPVTDSSDASIASPNAFPSLPDFSSIPIGD